MSFLCSFSVVLPFGFRQTQECCKGTKQLTFAWSLPVTWCVGIRDERDWAYSPSLWPLRKLHLFSVTSTAAVWFTVPLLLGLCARIGDVWFSTELKPDTARLRIDLYWSVMDCWWRGNGKQGFSHHSLNREMKWNQKAKTQNCDEIWID